MNPEEILSALNSFNYEQDGRQPPDRFRRTQFLSGWRNGAEGQTYTAGTLDHLTWNNVGYRFGSKFGEQTTDAIDFAYAVLAEDYLSANPPKGIPNGITAEHVHVAARQYESLNRTFSDSTRYDVIVDGKAYAPKGIVGVAAELLTGNKYYPRDFSSGSGGGQAMHLLKRLGFDVVPKAMEPDTKAAWLLTWNPANWDWVDFADIVGSVRSGRTVQMTWSCRNSGVTAGDRVFLLRQGRDRPGLIASGTATGRPFYTPHRDGSERDMRAISLLWDAVVDPDDVLPRERLLREPLDDGPWNSQQSGIAITPSVADALSEVWAEHYYNTTHGSQPMLLDRDDANDKVLQDYLAEVKVRRHQSKFRRRVLANFGHACCVTGVTESDLLVASHVVPWVERRESRLDPANGFCLFVTVDRLFDQGYISFGDDLRIITCRNDGLSAQLRHQLEQLEGRQATQPIEHPINLEYLSYHRTEILR